MAFIRNFRNSPLNPFYMFDREDPQDEANSYLKQIPGQGKKYYNPFIDQGREAGDLLKGEYSKLMDPTVFMNDIMKNYSLSEGAKYERDQLGRGIGNAAAAGGFAGTPDHQREYGEMADKVMSGDMQQYLQNALGIYGQGMKGEQDFYDKGFDASSKLADLIGGTLSSQGGMAYKTSSDRNADRQALMMAIAKALSQGAGSGAG